MTYPLLLSAEYRWLWDEPAPKHLRAALSLYGVKEEPGQRSNPEILGWAKDVGLDRVYTDDGIPWCGLFCAIVMHMADREGPAKPLWARDWLNWGTMCDGGQQLGDVLIYSRAGGGGHVGLYVGEDRECFHTLGGNQSDAVTITRIRKNRLIGSRRPRYIRRPTNIRRVFLTPRGAVSTNER